jgi:hypothetical protein
MKCLVVALFLGSAIARVCADEPKPAEFPADVRSVLEPAIAEQNAGAIATDLRDFYVKLLVQTRDRDQGALSFEVERSWAPNKLRTRVVESSTGKAFDEGYDGETFWLENNEGVTIFAGPKWKGDRKRIGEEVALMEVMMRSFFLARALPTIENLEREADQTIAQPDPAEADATVDVPCHVLKGRMTDLPEGLGTTADVTIFISAKEHRLERIRLDPVATNDPANSETDEPKPLATELRFGNHLANSQGILVPSNVDVYRGTSREPWQELRLAGEDGPDGGVLNSIRFNTGIDPTRFAPPKSK